MKPTSIVYDYSFCNPTFVTTYTDLIPRFYPKNHTSNVKKLFASKYIEQGECDNWGITLSITELKLILPLS